MKPDKKNYEKYMQAFIEQNSRVNLISKNDEKFLWEKHIFDSLAIGAVFDKYGMPASLLDIGTGGGFPAVPIALEYPEIEVYALDSIRKKINAIENIKSELDINNLHTICERAEKITEKFDMVFIDAAKGQYPDYLQKILPHLNAGGVIVTDNVLFRGYVLGTGKPPRRYRNCLSARRFFIAAKAARLLPLRCRL